MIEETNNNTLWCGNLADQVTEELLYELFLQAGPLEKVRIAKDKNGRQKNFAFITFCHEVSVPYAINLFRGTALFHKTLVLQCRGRMALLPPPIRCYGPEPPINFTHNMPDQFADMTRRLHDEDLHSVHASRHIQDSNDKLVVASLQGAWSHRHHPYHGKEQSRHREEHRSRPHYRDSNMQPHWRDRRSHKRGGYHNRD